MSEPLASVGQELKLVCTPQGGNPFPDLAFMLNGERVEPDNKEMTEQGGYNAVFTITVEDTHKNLDMSCIAENRMSSIPVASNHQTLSVRCKNINNIFKHFIHILYHSWAHQYLHTRA